MLYHGPTRVYLEGEGAQEYMPQAQKILSELVERARVGGVHVLSNLVNIEDATIRVSMHGSVKQIQIKVSPKNPEANKGPIPMEGFVVTPTDETQPFVQYSRDQQIVDARVNWGSWVYDGSRLNTAAHDHVRPRNLLGFYKNTFSRIAVTGNQNSDGLPFAGNVDWRNSDESLLVTWYGPRSRYFFEPVQTGSGVVTIRQPYVFCKGRAIFLLTDFETALIGAPTSHTTTWVTGACVQNTGNGLILLVAVQRIDTSTGTISSGYATFTDYVISVAIKEKGLSSYFTIVNSTARLIGSRQWEMVDDGSGGQYRVETDATHPWFWNGDGTEARCMRGYTAGLGQDDQRAREIIMSTPINRSAMFAVDDVALAGTTITVTGGATYGYLAKKAIVTGVANSAVGVVANCTPYVYPPGSGTTIYLVDYSGPTSTPVWTGDSPCFAGISPWAAPKVIDKTTVVFNPMGYKVAVDYRGLKPVYAYGVPTGSTTRVQASVTSWDATLSGGLTASDFVLTYVPSNGTTLADGSVSVTSGGTGTINLSGSRSFARTYSCNASVQNGGIRTDFLTVNCGGQFSSTVTSSYSDTYTCDKALNSSCVIVVTSAGSCYHGGIQPNPVQSGPYTLSGFGVADNANGSVTLSGSTQHTESSQGMSVYYLDLRYKIAAYVLVTQSGTTSATYNQSITPVLNSFVNNAHPGGVDHISAAGNSATDIGYSQSTMMDATNVLSKTGAGTHDPPASFTRLSFSRTTPASMGWVYTYPAGSAFDDRHYVNFSPSDQQHPIALMLFAGIATTFFSGPGNEVYGIGNDMPFLNLGLGDPNSLFQPPYPTPTTDASYDVPPDWFISAASVTTQHPQFNTTFGSAAAGLIEASHLYTGSYRDNFGFDWIGSWQSYKGAWMFSQCAVSNMDYSSGRANMAKGGDIYKIVGAPSYDTMFWPITVLPKTTAK